MIGTVNFNIGIREQMENIRLKANENANAKTFASGYIWSRPMDIKVHLEDDMYAMKNNSHGPTAWNFPVGEEKSKINFLNRLINIKELKLLKLTSRDVIFLGRNYPDLFVIEEAPDDNEYIYDAVEHQELAGKSFSNLRRMLNKFYREHEVQTVMLTRDNMKTAEEIMMLWGNAHESRGEMNMSGTEVDRFIIDHYDEIGMVGTLTCIDGNPSAVAIGYQISSDTCDIAETKFVPDIKHIGYVAVEEFMKTFGNRYRYFNNEEDMGINGLRIYKQCLKPCKMNVLWNAYLKGDIT